MGREILLQSGRYTFCEVTRIEEVKVENPIFDNLTKTRGKAITPNGDTIFFQNDLGCAMEVTSRNINEDQTGYLPIDEEKFFAGAWRY